MIRLLFVLLTFGLAPLANGLPVLQLGIGGGSYDNESKTIVTAEEAFTLYAYGKAKGRKKIDLDEFHYVAVAITPQIGPEPVDFGSFLVDGNRYDINSPEVVFGVPPLEENLERDRRDLRPHGIYPTYFLELAFLFDANQTTGFVNTRKSPDYLPTSSGNKLFYQGFNVDTSGLYSGFQLHFDLYNTRARNGDIDVDRFAPFSHDAGTIPQVSEPNSLLLLSGALIGFGFNRRRLAHRRKH